MIEIIKEENDYLIVKTTLKDIVCPYCEQRIKDISSEKKIHSCKIISYQKVECDRLIDNKKEKMIYTYKSKEIECKTNDCLLFEIEIDKKEWIISVYVPKDIKVSIKEEFENFLKLDKENILQLLKPFDIKEKRRTAVNLHNLTFDSKIRYLKMKDILLGRAFFQYLYKRKEK